MPKIKQVDNKCMQQGEIYANRTEKGNGSIP